MVQLAWVVALAFFLHGPQPALTQSPWRIKTTSKYELRFYDNRTRNFSTAKTRCASNAGMMVRMDDADVRKTVGDTVASASVVKYFWIGAERSQNTNNWNWLDGTPITPSLLDWYVGQPDNSGGIEHNLIIRKSDANYGDVPGHFQHAGTICQRTLVGAHNLQTSGLVLTETSTKEMTCFAGGYPAPKVTWKTGNTQILTSAIHGGLYQIKSTARAKLMVQNANVADEGQYECVALNTVGGKQHTLRKTVWLTVPSKPTILSIKPMSCNSSLSVIWKPHPRAVAVSHSIRVSADGGGGYVKKVLTSKDSFTQTFVTEILNSSALYDIRIAVDCDSCRTSYSDSGSNYTGGIPRQVGAPTLRKFNGSCEVSWTWPKYTPRFLISGFKVWIVFVSERIATGSKIISEVDEKIISPNLSFSIPRRPNRKHIVSITSQTCAGFGDAVVAKGSCITDVAAPESLKQPIAGSNEISQNGRLHISIKAPSEANGPISCIFVIVKNGNSSKLTATNEHILTKVNSSEAVDTYIAISMDKSSMAGAAELKLTLGDGSVTKCDIYTLPKKRSKRDIGSGLYVGQNKALLKEIMYKIYIVTSTPSEGGEVFFGISEPLQVIAKGIQDDRVTVNLYVGVAIGMFVIVAVCCATAAFIFKRKRKSDSAGAGDHNNTYEYPTIPMESEKETGYENPGLAMTAGSDAQGQAHPDTAYETFYDNQGAVKPSWNPDRGNSQTPVYEFVK